MSIMDSDLLNEYMSKCVFMNQSIQRDGYGGYESVWTAGADFDAVITEDLSRQATIAGLELATSFYGVKVENSVPLEFHSVFKRVSDGKTFRIRSSDVLKSPSFSPLGMKMLQAEEFDINNEQVSNNG